jgi:hypothetical protein
MQTDTSQSYSVKIGTSSTAYHLVVSTTGNVGIGTTSPTYKLDVVGDVNITGNYRINGNQAGLGDAVLSATQTWRGINTYQNATIYNSSITINANPNQQYALVIDTDNNPSDGYLVEIATAYPAYFPRAIAVFNATTNPPTILYSKNISSISSPATGVFTICMRYPAPTTNYAIMGMVGKETYSDVSLRGIQLDINYTRTNTCFQVWEKATNPNSQANENPPYVSVLVFY